MHGAVQEGRDLQAEQQPEPQAEPQLEPPAKQQPEPHPEPQIGFADVPAEAIPAPHVPPIIPPHLLGPNVGVVLPVVALPLNPDMAEEVDPNMIELD
jgi:hypothetical protein